MTNRIENDIKDIYKNSLQIKTIFQLHYFLSFMESSKENLKKHLEYFLIKIKIFHSRY